MFDNKEGAAKFGVLYLSDAELGEAIGKPVCEIGHMERFLIEQDKTAMRLISQNKVAQDKVDSALLAAVVKAKPQWIREKGEHCITDEGCGRR